MGILENLKKQASEMDDNEILENIHEIRTRRSVNANKPRSVKKIGNNKQPKAKAMIKKIDDKETLLAMLEALEEMDE